MIRKSIKNVATRSFRQLRRIEDMSAQTNALLLDINHRLSQQDSRLDRLRQAYGRVDPYQPPYGIAGFGHAQRDTKDRCAAIYKYLANNVDGMRILDVGCYAGFASFYFADRGAAVTGTDNRVENIEVCKLVDEITGLGVKFKLEEFSPESISMMKDGEYDAVMILSVLHWTTHEKGLKYVQTCMAKLLDKVPMVIVELAQKHEDKKLYWDKAVPENDLDIFAKVKGIDIKKIGEFPTHLSNKKRPIYVVTKKHLEVNGKNYEIERQFKEAYADAPKWRPIDCTYYVGKNVFIKQYNHGSKVDQTARQTINEINFFLQNESVHNSRKVNNLPKLIDYEINQDNTKLVFSRIDGVLLSEKLKAGLKVKEIERITRKLVETLILIERLNIYHNDLRSWNIMIDQKDNPYIIDFELATPQPIEDNFVAFLWVVNAMLTGEKEGPEGSKTNLPPRPNFSKSRLLLAMYDSLKGDGPHSFSNLLKALSE